MHTETVCTLQYKQVLNVCVLFLSLGFSVYWLAITHERL